MNGHKPEHAEWVGKTLAELCARLGNPDCVEPASVYSVVFRDGSPSVALTYRALGHRWFLDRDGRVQGVVRIKE
ncbi:MAG TPA: hypothetical protein VLV83_07560 [Acidobacteriota bacterium]|nr:hypothetical protein [Acidobacteriota bacterium]